MIAGIVLINLVLSGDNAVVIGLAAHRLPSAVRRRAIVLGSVGAIGLRIVFTALAAVLLRVPVVELAGGVVLVWIAYKLLLPADAAPVDGLDAGASIWEAIQTIVLADVVMSLDNVLAIGGAARGDVWLMLFGLTVSMPLIAVGGGVVARLLDALPWLVYLGAGVLAWTAGGMILDDDLIASRVELAPIATVLVPAALTALVLVAGAGARRRARAAPE